MSFSSRIKSELLQKDREDSYAFLAFSYGIFLFASSFTSSSVYMKTENEEIAETYAFCAEKLAGVKVKKKKSAGGICTYSVESPEDRKKIFSAFSLTGNELTLRINRGNIEDEEYLTDFLAGVFLSCGTAADPSKDYHLDFSVGYKRLSYDLANIISEIDLEQPLEPKVSTRKYSYVVYLKGSERIEDILVFMGAQISALSLMDVKVEKDVRNRANRISNCDTANVEKTIKSGLKQAQAIKKIQEEKGFEYIPEELREIAAVRIENPDMSLAELADCLSESLTRSGVNHRLKRLEKLAEEI